MDYGKIDGFEANSNSNLPAKSNEMTPATATITPENKTSNLGSPTITPLVSAQGSNSSSAGENASLMGAALLNKTGEAANKILAGAEKVQKEMQRAHSSKEFTDTNDALNGQSPENGNASIVLLSQRLKQGSGGYNDIIGQVKNIVSDTVEFVKIGLTVYDENGDVIGTDFTYSSPDTLKPSQKASFDLLSEKDNFKGMKNYELSLQWRDADGTDQYIENAQLFRAQD